MNIASTILTNQERTNQRIECYKVLRFIEQSLLKRSSALDVTIDEIAAATCMSKRQVVLALLRLMVPNASSLYSNERHIECTITKMEEVLGIRLVAVSTIRSVS